MSEFLNPLQLAIFTRLSSQLSVPVYDDPPNQLDGQPELGFPFVTIGDDTGTPWDTDNSLGTSATVTIHVWSRYAGRKEVKTIFAAIYTALNRQSTNLTAPGYAFIDCLYEFSEIIEDIDGRTRHGVCRYRVTMEKT